MAENALPNTRSLDSLMVEEIESRLEMTHQVECLWYWDINQNYIYGCRPKTHPLFNY
jgi:hypothetical protein